MPDTSHFGVKEYERLLKESSNIGFNTRRNLATILLRRYTCLLLKEIINWVSEL